MLFIAAIRSRESYGEVEGCILNLNRTETASTQSYSRSSRCTKTEWLLARIEPQGTCFEKRSMSHAVAYKIPKPSPRKVVAVAYERFLKPLDWKPFFKGGARLKDWKGGANPKLTNETIRDRLSSVYVLHLSNWGNSHKEAALTFVANRREQSVSCSDSSFGEIFTNIKL